MVNRNIFAARGRVVNNIPRGILSTVCQAALELDVNLVRLVRCTKDRTICIFPELIELNVDQFALGVGKDCGNFSDWSDRFGFFARHNSRLPPWCF